MSTGEERQEGAAAEVTEEAGSFLDQVCDVTKQTERDDVELMLRALVEGVEDRAKKFDKNTIRTISGLVSGIDAVVSTQLAEIMHVDAFQKLEGSWRGLHHLVMNSETGTMLKLRVLNASKADLRKDLEKAVEFDQSEMFKKIYESEFGTAGGIPYGALVGDFSFENTPDDIAMLKNISGVAASGHTPFLTTPAPSLFGLDDWTELTEPRDLAKIFDGKSHIEWRDFRDTEDARYVVMTMPRTLARLPYGEATRPVEEFSYEEVETGKNGEAISVSHDQYCWMSTAYVMGAKLNEAFAQTQWCTRIRGANSGGRVEGLPTHIFKADDGDLDQKCPTEVAITDRREKELSDLGFMPLVHYKDTNYAVFFGGQTCQKPKKYNKASATENAAISARLPYIMAASRIAHYLKVIGRDMIGSAKEASDVEDFLNEWIMGYVSADDKPKEEQKYRYPLQSAKVLVREVPGSPGAYDAQVFMRPWLFVEELNADVSMVTKIPEGLD